MDSDIIDSKNCVFAQKDDPYGPLRQDFSRIFTENNLDTLTNANDIGFIDTGRSRHHRPADGENIGFTEMDNHFLKISHREDLSPNPKSLLQMGYSPATYMTTHIGFNARDLFGGPGKGNNSESFGLTPVRHLHKFPDEDYGHYDGNFENSGMRYLRTPSDLVDNLMNDIPLSLMWGHDSTKALRKKLAATPSDFFNQNKPSSFGANFVPPVYRGNDFDDEEDLAAKDDDIEEPDQFQKIYQNNLDKEQLEIAKLFIGKIEPEPSNSTLTTAQKTSNSSAGSNQKAFRTPNKIKVKEEFKTGGKSTPQSKGRDRDRDRDDDDDGDDGPGSEHRSSRGLRVLSVKVKDIVGEKKKTSYKEVADDLIAEFSNKLKLKKNGESKDEQNVKRRVYDALNVLIAADILKKDGKTVFCDESLANIGAPQRRKLKEERDIIEHQINDASRRKKKKVEVIRELISKCLAIKSLVNRNKETFVVESPEEHHQQLVISEPKDSAEDKENKHVNLDHIKEEQEDSKSKKPKTKKVKAKGKENENDTLKVHEKSEKSGDVFNNALSEEPTLCNLAEDEIIRFPFIVVVSQATENAMNLNMNSTQRQLSIESKNSFDLFGDIDILLKMKLHHVTEEFFNQNIPAEVQKYVIRADKEAQHS